MQPRDPRVKALWVLLRRRQLLAREPVDQGRRCAASGRTDSATPPPAHHASECWRCSGRGECSGRGHWRATRAAAPEARGNPAAPAPPPVTLRRVATARPLLRRPLQATRRPVDAARASATASADATAPADSGEKTRTLNGAVQDASALYRRFTRLPARSLQRVSHERLMPPVVVELGRLVGGHVSVEQVGRPSSHLHPLHGRSAAARLRRGRPSPLRHRRQLSRHRAGDRRMNLGLDELIIVNPGPAAPSKPSWFLGDDGGLYRIGRPGRRHRDSTRPRSAMPSRCRGSSSATTECCTRRTLNRSSELEATWRKCKESKRSFTGRSTTRSSCRSRTAARAPTFAIEMAKRDARILRFFVDVQNKTRLETNLQASGTLPSLNSYEVRAMRVVVSPLLRRGEAEHKRRTSARSRDRQRARRSHLQLGHQPARRRKDDDRDADLLLPGRRRRQPGQPGRCRATASPIRWPRSGSPSPCRSNPTRTSAWRSSSRKACPRTRQPRRTGPLRLGDATGPLRLWVVLDGYLTRDVQ